MAPILTQAWKGIRMTAKLDRTGMTAIGLTTTLLLKLVTRNLISIEDATEVLEASLAALEDLPPDEETGRLRQVVEHAASKLSASATALKPDQ